MMRTDNPKSIPPHLSYVFILLTLVIWASQTLSLPAERHPILLYEEADVARIKERVTREPYSSWWEWIKNQADGALSVAPGQIGSERHKTNVAKALAFTYVITEDSIYAEKAVEILKSVLFPPRGGDLGEPHFEGEAVANYVEAYDMLFGYLRDDPSSDSVIRDIIAEEANRLYAEISIAVSPLIEIPLWKTSLKNNWHIRAYSALGMAAIVLADYPGAQEWHERAKSTVIASLYYQIDEDGGCAEGPYYSRYSADIYIPYMLALRRFSGEDLLNDPKIHAMHDWSLKIRMPNGARPNIDDSSVSYFLGHYLASVHPDGSLHRWDWEDSSLLYAEDYYKADAIALFDDTIPPKEPDFNPTVFMPEAGDAVFRSDWSPDATYMLLRGEHGKARENGFSHEHPDATSFIIYAKGEMLALDGGYISFTEHHKVNKAQNHNLILVDGKGPPLRELLGEVIGAGVDAQIENFFTTDFLDYSEVSTEYEGVGFRRKVIFPGKDYFVLVDEVSSQSGSHTYDWLLHGNGGGTSGGDFLLEGNKARWTFNDAELIAYMAAPEDAQITEDVDIHSFEYAQELTHSVMKASVEGEDVRYISVLFPKEVGEEDPKIAALYPEEGEGASIRRDDVLDIVLAKDKDFEVMSISLEDSFRMDGELSFLRLRSGELESFSIQGGRSLIMDTRQVFSCPEKVDIALHLGEDSLYGYVRGDDSLMLEILTEIRPDTVYFKGEAVDFAYKAGLTTLDLGGEGDIVISLGQWRSGDFDWDGSVGLDDFFLFVVAFGTSSDLPKFDPTFDLNGDGRVDLDDFFIFVGHFGERTG